MTEAPCADATSSAACFTSTGKLHERLCAPHTLRGRFRAHHALLVRLALAHPEQLERSIAELDAHIDRVLTPFAAARDRLDSITGVGKRPAETIIAEIGVDTSVFPTAAHLPVVGWPLLRQQPHRRQAPLRQAQQGQPLAG